MMNSSKPDATPLPAPLWAAFDPRLAPVLGMDAHLDRISADRLSPDAIRLRFQSPRAWTPENSVEKRFSERTPALAAVLIPLVMREELMLLLTQRAETLSTHSGQIAFPGGRVDSGDRDAADTALREASEEIGLPRDDVEVLGTLPTYTTGTAFIITPVVALVRPGARLTPNPGEVADVFEVPLRYLMNPANHRRHEVELGGVQRQWLSMPYRDQSGIGDGATAQERFIWGATAGMLRNLYRFLAS
jgi:8-oxo-dGTP pyrophosphatase MutT (NUDIX family)